VSGSRHEVPLTSSHFVISRDIEPRLTVQPGDVVTLETEDAFGGQITKPGDRRDRRARPESNGVTGPVYVEGAEAGDALRVRILDIRPANGQCATYLWPYPYVTDALGAEHEHQTRICMIEDGVIHWSAALDIPYRPMIGVIATAPASHRPTTDEAGDHGGNLDLREIAPGAEVWLPVETAGGLLMVGDCHAGQGDGEIGGAALEMAAHVEISVHLEKGARLEGPRIITADEIVAVATGVPMERSVAVAFGRLARWMETGFGINRFEAYLLLTQVGRVSLGYFELGVVAAKISKSCVELVRGSRDDAAGPSSRAATI
jgi:amidase